MVTASFDWDDGNRAKCQRHGVSITEIEGVLTEAPRVAPDLAHSDGEDRFIAVGRNAQGRAISSRLRFAIVKLDG